MYCPNCGKENSVEQKFCRSCGLNLEKTADALSEQLHKFEGFSKSQMTKFFEIVGKLGFGGLIGTGLAGIIILIIILFNKFVLSGQTDKIIMGLIFIVLIISAVFGLAYVIFQEYLKDKNKNSVTLMQNQIERKDTAKLLEEKSFEPIPSVIESTTNLLFVDKKSKTSGELS